MNAKRAIACAVLCRYSENAAFGAGAAVFQKVPEGCDGAAAASMYAQGVCARVQLAAALTLGGRGGG